MRSDQIQIISPETVAAWLQAENILLLDVREEEEYAHAHIKGAVLFPLSTFQTDQLPLKDGQKLVIHCRSGQRCGMAAMRLVMDGFAEDIYRMEGGILAWDGLGLPVQRP
jgi:rhodanese-related sulfurtransferase